MTADETIAEEVENRRRQLRRWIAERYDGVQSRFVEKTGINQGELSGLLRQKSFGSVKARKLEAQAEMPYGYLDQREGRPGATEPVVIPYKWPFSVSYQRFSALTEEQKADIDGLLDYQVSSFERKNSAPPPSRPGGGDRRRSPPPRNGRPSPSPMSTVIKGGKRNAK